MSDPESMTRCSDESGRLVGNAGIHPFLSISRTSIGAIQQLLKCGYVSHLDFRIMHKGTVANDMRLYNLGFPSSSSKTINELISRIFQQQ